MAVHRENAGEYHGLYFFKTLNHLRVRVIGQGNGIPHFYFLSNLDPCDNISYITGFNLGFRGLF